MARRTRAELLDKLKSEGCDCTPNQWVIDHHCTITWIRCKGRLKWTQAKRALATGKRGRE